MIANRTITLNDAEELPPVQTVNFVDLERYDGLWYEVARTPNLFQIGCSCVTATYEIIDETSISISNSCNRFGPNGPVTTVEGVGIVTNPETNAELEIFFEVSTVPGEYWILDLVEDPSAPQGDYTYAVVGDSERDFLFILSRTPNPDPETLEDLYAGLEAQFYDTDELIPTPQDPECNYPETEEPVFGTNKAVFSDTGEITGIVEAFRNVVGMGGDNNGNEIGSQGDGFREINWDGGVVPFNMPGNFFNNQNLPVNGLPRGVEFSRASDLSLFGVSNPVLPADPFFGDNEFDTFNSNYPEQFTTFSSPRLFAPLDSNFMDVDFFEPGVFDEDGEPVPTLVTGFGAIFTDVDLPESTKLELFDKDGDLLFSQFVEPDPQGLSFLGVAFDQPVVSKVRITSGNAPLSLGLDDDPFGTGVDVVAMDNFIYGEPVVA